MRTALITFIRGCFASSHDFSPSNAIIKAGDYMARADAHENAFWRRVLKTIRRPLSHCHCNCNANANAPLISREVKVEKHLQLFMSVSRMAVEVK